MTKAELVQILGWRLGDRDDLADRINLELDYVQDYVLEAHPWLPWFLLSGEVELATVAGSRTVALPASFLLEDELSFWYLGYPDGSTAELEKLPTDVAARKYVGPGTPVAYSVAGLAAQFYPLPDAVYPVFTRFYQKDERIRDETKTTKWLAYAADVVVAEVGSIIASKHIKDANAAATFAADAQTAWNRLYTRHVAIQELNQSRSMGGNT